MLQGILINGQFPGPEIYSVTNDNLIINVHNQLNEPFLLSWLALFLFFLVFNVKRFNGTVRSHNTNVINLVMSM